MRRASVSALRRSVVGRWLAVFVRVCLFVRVYRIFTNCPLKGGHQQRLATQLRHDGGNSDQIGGICDHHHHHFTNLRLSAEVLRNIPLPGVLQDRTWNCQASGTGKYWSSLFTEPYYTDTIYPPFTLQVRISSVVNESKSFQDINNSRRMKIAGNGGRRRTEILYTCKVYHVLQPSLLTKNKTSN